MIKQLYFNALQNNPPSMLFPEIDIYGIYIPLSGRNGSFTILCNGPWFIISKPYWFLISKTSGVGTDIIDFNVSPYTESREGFISFGSRYITNGFYISQFNSLM